ncbi:MONOSACCHARIDE-SENSING PROTEIN 1 [Salix purpurea]|uniref:MONOSACCHARIDE-SENSING PROTEIN 1 n=1 Tax=Salix purpurea TaxID=77065 RepID=A0A9Q0W3J7_SALPP|nr:MONOSACCHARIDE-SENSING PROTEIN 1 [Salix purpurea]
MTNHVLGIALGVHERLMHPLMLCALQNTEWCKLNSVSQLVVGECSSYLFINSSSPFTSELALLVEGLGVGTDISIEEYIIGPANDFTDDHDISADKDHIKLYGPEQGHSWVARPVSGQSAIGLASRHGSMVNQSLPLMDPLVTLFGSVHEKLPEQGSMRSMLFPHFGSMFSVGGNHPRNDDWDEESQARDGDDYASDGAAGDSDDNLQSPLISRQATSMDKDMVPPSHGSMSSMRHGSLITGNAGDPVGNTGIGGGWQLAWKWSEREGQDGKKEGGFKRIYLHQEGAPGSRRGSLVSLTGADAHADSEYIQAAALVSQSVLYPKELVNENLVGPAMVHPSETVAKGPSWRDLFEPGVKHALAVGVGIQILQQFAGINGVLYYTPQILEQAGVGVLLSNLGLSSASTSLLISALTTLLMLPCIAVAMRLMDISGRRTLLLTTIPCIDHIPHFVSPWKLEIFPTRVRGLCIAICALTFWICDIIVTYTLPLMLKSIGLAGVFGLYAIVCIISFVFVYLKVPETKGMPLEVISEFFAVGAKQAAAAKEN